MLFQIIIQFPSPGGGGGHEVGGHEGGHEGGHHGIALASLRFSYVENVFVFTIFLFLAGKLAEKQFY